MRLRILSDLHREFAPLGVSEIAADVVVLAGDIDRGAKGVAWARQAFPSTPVLYVAGNHEHYGERLGRLHEKLREAASGSNVIVLENEAVSLSGYRFFGATLWTDFNLFGDPLTAMLAAGDRATGMNDYRKIRRRDAGKLLPKHTAALHADARLAIAEFLASGDRSRSIVITHHAPSARSVATGMERDIFSAAYTSHLDSLIVEKGPALWVHGHIHETRDYSLGATRILSNPRGYPMRSEAEARGFRDDMVVDI